MRRSKHKKRPQPKSPGHGTCRRLLPVAEAPPIVRDANGEETVDSLRARMLRTPTQSRQWFDNVQRSPISDADMPAFLLTRACAIAGPGVIAHQPFLDGDPRGEARVDHALWF